MKLWNYVVMITFLSILLEMAGISSGFDDIFRLIGLNLDNIGNECIENATCRVWDFSISKFLGSLFSKEGLDIGILTALTLGGVVAGLLYRAPIEKVVSIPFITGTVYLYIKVFANIVNYSASYSSWVVYTIVALMVPLGVGFAYSVFDWWSQTD